MLKSGVFGTGLTALAVYCTVAATPAMAQNQGPPPYGSNISQEMARKAGMAAVAEAKKNGWRMAVTVVDTSGALVFFERIDDTNGASVLISQKKARSAVLYRRDTKAFSERLAKGATFYLTFPEVAASEGGILIVSGGKVIGAIGSSGGTGEQDGMASAAGAAALK